MGRPIRCLLICLLALGSLAGSAAAHRPADPPHQLYQIGDLTLESGQVIKDFAISYVTHGTLNAQKSNAILMVTALSGNTSSSAPTPSAMV
jgi:homoserine O-acetyltransferase